MSARPNARARPAVETGPDGRDLSDEVKKDTRVP